METPPASQPSPPIAETKPAVEADEKIFATVGYFAFLFVVPLIAKPKSKFCQFHAKQSMVLFLISILVLVVLAAVPMVGSLFTLALFALYVLSLYRAFIGDWWKIPFIGMFADKINLESLYGKAGLTMSDLGHFKENIGAMAGKVEQGIQKLGQSESKTPTEQTSPPNPPTANPPENPPAAK